MENPNNTDNRLPVVLHVQDCIVLYQGLDRELCSAVVEYFDGDESRWRGKAGRSGQVSYEGEVKNSWDLEILDEGAGREIFRRIHPKIEACLSHYLSKSPILQSFHLQVTGYKIQMYPKNEGYFRWHADSVERNSRDRVAAMVLYLNDVEKGGETEFFHQRMKVSPRAGQLLMFPTGWNYMHCGHMPESADKYIISSFIKIKD